jgi:mannose-6-phosphate isomerase-like protein (cupin superfamily)
MAYAGQTLSNPVSGERITFRQTAADTGGELLDFDLRLSPDGHVPGMHVHPRQEERFEVLAGTMKFRLGLRRIVAGPGDTVVIPPGRAHKFANGGPDEAHVRVQVAPALDMEQLFETTVALAKEGRTNRKGMPTPLHLALFVRRYENEVRAPFAPAALVRVAMAPLAALARRLGHAGRYEAPAPVAGVAMVAPRAPLANAA